MRIQEARDAVEAYATLINLLEEIETVLRDGSSMKSINETMAEIFYDEILALPSMMREASQKGASIKILNDNELINLRKEMAANIRPSLKRLMNVSDKILEDENSDVEEVRNEINLDELQEDLSKAGKLIIKMKSRLDKLAQLIP